MHRPAPFIRRTSCETAATIIFDGKPLKASIGENLAGALLAAGIDCFHRNRPLNTPRAPFCMMGTCYDCRVDINGERVQACMTRVTDGLVIHTASTDRS